MFYVYAHKEADTGKVFYVGQGSKTRAWQTGCRNVFWKRIYAKHGRTVEVLEDGLERGESFIREIHWIAHYRSLGLCRANFSRGGDGLSVTCHWWGKAISRGLKKRFNAMPKARGQANPSFKHFVDDETLKNEYKTLNTIEIAQRHGVSTTTIWSRLKQLGVPLRPFGSERQRVRCLTDGKEFDSLADCARFYGLQRANVRKVIHGKYKHTGGKQFTYL